MCDNPPRLAFDLERDLRAVAAMASNLTPYLYEKEVYGYLESDLPKLTLGGLLLHLYRLSRLNDILDTNQQTIVHDAQINFEAERSKWSVHYENKLLHELHTRIDAFTYFLDECAEDVKNCAASYPSQAEKRTMIEHLWAEAQACDLELEELRGQFKLADQKLRRSLRVGEFIFDERLTKVYPNLAFWWLYGCIPENN